MTTRAIRHAYRLVAELLLNPDDRRNAAITASIAAIEAAPADVRDPIERFMADPLSDSRDEYVRTIELSPPCPLYLGAHLFDEPTSCRNVGSSPRNAYMVELGAVYRHFGLQPDARELPDYVPLVADFLAASVELDDRDGIGLRRRLLERLVRPALTPLREGLEKLESPYALLIAALERVVEIDLIRLGDWPAWAPADRTEPPVRPLRVVRSATRPVRRSADSQTEVRS
jgi:nitrate reductase delta subunit